MRGLILALAVAAVALPSHAQKSKWPGVVVPPAVAPLFPEERYGEWYVNMSGRSAFASTKNDSGSALGVICNSSCAFFINPLIPCKQDARFPVLVNSPAGAFPVTLMCTQLERRYLYTATVSGTLLDAMEIGGELGVAMPMESGQFRVVRFSLTGALKATTRAFELSEAGKEDTGQKGLRDQTL